MWTIGLDVHWKGSTFCVLDENGREQKTRTVRGNWEALLSELAMIRKPFAIAFEASTGYGFLHDRLDRIAERVEVAHPGYLRLIFRSKRKNDRVDAQKLAKLLYLNEVPTVYVPTAEMRAWRRLIEHRQGLLQERNRVKNRIRALLRSHGLQAPKGLWTRKGREWLKAQALPSVMDAAQRDLLAQQLESVQALITTVEKALQTEAQKHPGVELLMSIPGVGIRTAEAVVAYIADPSRFHSAKAVGRYFGLVPCQDASADRNRLGHITREGPATVRRLVAEAAWQGIRRSATVRAYFQRIQKGDPDRKKIALVATAHYLLRVMHALLRTGEEWRETSTESTEKTNA